MPVPVADLPVAAGRSRVGRSAAFRIVGLEFCISAILNKSSLRARLLMDGWS